MPASARSGPIGGIDVCPATSGGTRASRKKVCAATHSDRAGAPTLKPMRSGVCFLRHDNTSESSAIAAVAGAGPKSIAAAMKNVSATEMLASTVAIRIVRDPARMPRTANSVHSYERPGDAARTRESTATAPPATTTARTYHERARPGIRLLRVRRRQRRIRACSPDNLILVVGPPHHLLAAAAVVNRRAPDDLVVVVHARREPTVDQVVGPV